MKPVQFNSLTHKLDRFAFTFSPDPSGVVALSADQSGQRKVKMRYLIQGEPEIGDWRKFRMLPEDAALCVGNAKKRLALQPKGGIPQLFEHGWGPEGGRAGGYWLDLYEESGDLWAVVLLDEPTWAAAVDPGLNWFGRSAGFNGWLDPDGFIRPADIFEGSFTNFPAMKGLGDCQPMQELEEKFSRRTAVQMQRLSSGLISPVIPDMVTPGTSTTSPAEASYRKERDMKLSAETLKLLGFAENADPTPEQIDNAVRAKQGTATQSTVSIRSEVLQVMDELRARDREEVGAQLRAEFEARDKERAIDAVLLEAEKAGKITAADREKYRAMGRQMGAEALRDVVSKFATSAPTTRAFEAGNSLGATVDGGRTIAELCEQENATLRSERMSTWARRYAAEKGISFEQAVARLNTHASNVIEGVN